VNATTLGNALARSTLTLGLALGATLATGCFNPETADRFDDDGADDDAVDEELEFIIATYTSTSTEAGGEAFGPYVDTLAYDRNDDTVTFLDDLGLVTMVRSDPELLDTYCP